MPCKVDLCACELGVPVFVLLTGISKLMFDIDFFLVFI